MLRFLVTMMVTLAVAIIIAGAALTAYVVPGLPDIETLRDVQMQVPLHIYTSDGSLIAAAAMLFSAVGLLFSVVALILSWLH